MNAKTLPRIVLLVAVALTITMAGCKKTETTAPPDNTQSASLQQLSVDDNEMQSMSDETSNDAMNVMNGGNGGNLKSGPMMWPCNTTVDSSNVVGDTLIYYITYNGLNCPETLMRTGQERVKKHVGTHWNEPGAQVVVELINYQVTRVATGKTRTMNGRWVFTNVSGGMMWNLLTGLPALVHRSEGYMTTTFDDNTVRTWNIARQRVFTASFADSTVFMTIDGFGQADGYSNLVTWGINRNGEQFYSQINESVVHRSSCNFDPVSGVTVYQVPSKDKSATVTFGYDSNNNLITNGDCPAKYRLDWQHNGNSGTLYLWLH